MSALTALALEVLLLLALRVPREARWALFTRAMMLVLAAGLTAVTILLYGESSGTVHWHFLLITVSDGSITLAVATFLRVLAIALPSVLLFVDTEPTELADGLGQVLRLPARFVLGALAGVRLVGLLGQDWRYLGYARRARGVADQDRIRRTAGQAFALLVSAIRRGLDAGHRDGGTRLRRVSDAHLGAAVSVRLARDRVDLCGFRHRRGGDRHVGEHRTLELHWKSMTSHDQLSEPRARAPS